MSDGSEHVRPVAAAYPPDQAAAAQEALARRTHVGKIVLHPWVPNGR